MPHRPPADSTGRRVVGRRPYEHLGAQAVRPQRHRCAVRAPRRAHCPAVRRRRPGARTAPRHVADALVRGLRRGVRPGPAGTCGRRARCAPCASACIEGLRQAMGDIRLNGARNRVCRAPSTSACRVSTRRTSSPSCPSWRSRPAPPARRPARNRQRSCARSDCPTRHPGLDPDRDRSHHHRMRDRVRDRTSGGCGASAQGWMRSPSRSPAMRAIWFNASSNSASRELCRRCSNAARISWRVLPFTARMKGSRIFLILVVQLESARTPPGCIDRDRRSPARRLKLRSARRQQPRGRQGRDGADQGQLARARRPAHGVDHRAMQRLDAVKRADREGPLGDPGCVLEHAAEQLDEAVALQTRQLVTGDRGRAITFLMSPWTEAELRRQTGRLPWGQLPWAD